MEYVEVELICKTCKEPFTYKRSCHNALEAEVLEYKAVHRRKPICPACLKKEKDAAELAKAAEMGLPILMGRSEKQISYALSLRNRYLSKHPSALKAAQRNLAVIDKSSDRLEELAAKNGFRDVEEFISEAFRQIGLYKEYLCLTECNAQILIDTLAEKK